MNPKKPARPWPKRDAAMSAKRDEDGPRKPAPSRLVPEVAGTQEGGKPWQPKSAQLKLQTLIKVRALDIPMR